LLELLAENSISRQHATVSEMSVRGLAEQIGLTKDTVARALQRLQRAGLVTRRDARLDDGRFGRGSYVLDIPRDVLTIRPTRASTPPHVTAASPRPAEQLTLLDASDGPWS
jgi:DNA-binding IclR family transcriptional regulator